MYTYDLQIAGVRIRIPASREICFPESFQTFLTPVQGNADITMEVVFGCGDNLYSESDSLYRITHSPDGEDIIRVVPAGKVHTYRLGVPAKLENSVRQNGNWLLFMALEQMLLPYHRIILHASAVIHEGMAYVFSAPSGTGKSTQADIWHREFGAEIINGDKVILAVENGTVTAWGSPAAGSSGIYKNIGAPVAAIILLEQSNRNEILPASNSNGYFRIYNGLVKQQNDPAFNQTLLTYIETIMETIPILHLSCLPNRDAAQCVLDWMQSNNHR